MSNHVVCVKWGNKYISQYVNVLKSMINRHTTLPFQFHCFTEDPKGLDVDINVIPFPGGSHIRSWWSNWPCFKKILASKALFYI